MRRPAQYEKAVTISEPRGYPLEGLRPPMGSKTPLSPPERFSVTHSAPFPWPTCFPEWYSSLIVFNGLRAENVSGWKRLMGRVRYLLDGHADSTLTARFGPNFVTIQPIGECVCRSF
jgi:hypothetical protein